MGLRQSIALRRKTAWVTACYSVTVAADAATGNLLSGDTHKLDAALADFNPRSDSTTSAVATESAVKFFKASYRLQSENGDLVSAFEGFDALTRARRGDPWPGRSRNDPACYESFQTSTAMPQGQAGRAVDDEASCVDAFLEANTNTIHAFATEEQDRAATMSDGEVIPFPSGWSPDTMFYGGRGNIFLTSLHKLDHDREQIEYLIQRKRLPEAFRELVKRYKEARLSIAQRLVGGKEGILTEEVDRSDYFGMGSFQFELLRGTYNSLLYLPRGPAQEGRDGSRPFHPTGFKRALNPQLDWRAIEQEYLDQEVPLLWFDGFLQPEALEGILEFCREATIFFDIKPGYLGAYATDGLTSPWLLQVANELQEQLPRVLDGMTLSNMWAYKFDSDTSMDGIKIHADSASVNLDFWVTPDDANLDPSSGGLVVYPKAPPNRGAPPGADFDEDTVDPSVWNNWGKASYVKEWLESEGVLDEAVSIPYRQNRVVLFDSRLLHETDVFRFRQGYENRRINLTLLFSPKLTPSAAEL